MSILMLIGALTGLHAATWGAYKDSRFEGFHPARFVRSILLGIGVSVPVGLSGIAPSDGVLVVIGCAYAAERLATEWWKAILRVDDQSAYTIPMRVAVHGRTIDNPFVRYAVGAAVLAGLLAALVVASRSQSLWADLPRWALVLAAGIGGWLTAFGGAWKDAPIEGFELAKFFRSPLVATGWAAVLAPFTSQLAVLSVAAAGLAVATIETYKTFLNGRAPGKFGDKPVRYPSDGVRRACRALHVGLYLVLAGTLTATIVTTVPDSGAARPDQLLALIAALVLCGGYAMVVSTTPTALLEDEERADVAAPALS